MPWGGFYRPMSGLFYLAVFSLFGLNPAPYHVATWLVLLASAYLMYRMARLLGGGELAAGLAALVACYHVGLSNLNYNTAFVPDVLCYFFYLGSFVYYARIRKRGRLLGTGETLAFLGLYLCALDSKEMAVTLPVVLLVYEWIYHRPERPDGRGILEWLRGPGKAALFGSVLNLLYIYGLAFGPDRMMSSPAYHPVFALQRVKWFQQAYLGDLLLGWSSGWVGMLALWAALAYLAWRRDRPVLRFCWMFMVLTPLPIEFLEGRSGACLAIPMAGWAIFGAVVLGDLVDVLAGVLSREPILRRLGRKGLAAALAGAAVLLWARENRRRSPDFVMAALGRPTWEVIEQFRAVNPSVRPGSRVAFLDDPLQSWDMLFVAELWFRDRSLAIHVARAGPLSPDELEKMDCVFTFEDGKLIRLR
ncbi:MAG: hypothetical protein ABSB88_00955 [Bryobacteraceae bacterium]|jgi:hypothetical protein